MEIRAELSPIVERHSAFTSKQFRKYCEERNIKLILTAVSTPRAAEQVERMNAVILDRLISIISEEQVWDKYLDQTKMSINNTINEATGKMPNELLFGFNPRTTAEAFLAHTIDEDLENGNSDDDEKIIANFTQQRAVTRQEAARRNEERQEQMRLKTGPAREFQVGDIVVIPNANASTKTKLRWKGPYKISEVHPHNRYRIAGMDATNTGNTIWFTHQSN